MREAIQGFLTHLSLEKNASAHTVRAYRQDLEQFSAHAREVLGREARPQDVDHLLVRSFLARLHERGLRKTSSARRLAALRTFFRWLCREGVLERNPARALLSPRTDRHVPAHLEEEEVDEVVEVELVVGTVLGSDVEEEVLVELASWLHERTGERRLALAGGVALNCVANSHLAEHGPFDEVWVQPAAGDAGTALGAALHVARELGDDVRPMATAV